MTIGHLIQSRSGAVVSCSTDTLVSQAAALLAERRIGAMPVMDGDQISGIFSERDVIYQLGEKGAEALSMRVAEAMTAPAVTVEPQTSILAALSLMTRRRIRHLPVIENGVMIDFVSIGDLVKHRIEKIEAEADALRTYIQTA